MRTKRKTADHLMHRLAMAIAMLDQKRQVFITRQTAPERDNLAVIGPHREALIARRARLDNFIAYVTFKRVRFAKRNSVLKWGHSEKGYDKKECALFNPKPPISPLSGLLNSRLISDFPVFAMQQAACGR